MLDGATGEGGGQILRTALALGAVVGRRVEVINIRAGRQKPGIAPQHLAAVRAVAAACDGELEGDAIGSQRVALDPGRAVGGRYLFDVADERPSAGATTLVAQALLPVLATCGGPSQVTIRGGTHVPWSPPVHYLAEVLGPTLAAVGVGLEVRLRRWGWYPRGGGEIEMTLSPARRLAAVSWTERGSLASLRGLSAVTNLPSHVVARQARAARSCLEEDCGDLGTTVRFDELEADGTGRGSFCFLRADYQLSVGHSTAGYASSDELPPPAGFSALGRKGLPAEAVGREAARTFVAHHRSGAAVDEHLADQILPFLALASGTSRFAVPRLTAHIRANAWVCEQLLDTRIEIEQGPPGLVVVHGAGVR